MSTMVFLERSIDKPSKTSKLKKISQQVQLNFLSFKLHFKQYSMPPPKNIYQVFIYLYI